METRAQIVKFPDLITHLMTSISENHLSQLKLLIVYLLYEVILSWPFVNISCGAMTEWCQIRFPKLGTWQMNPSSFYSSCWAICLVIVLISLLKGRLVLWTLGKDALEFEGKGELEEASYNPRLVNWYKDFHDEAQGIMDSFIQARFKRLTFFKKIRGQPSFDFLWSSS